MKKFITTMFCALALSAGAHVYADSYVMHTIEPGETYGIISKEYGQDINQLKSINKDLGETLYAGSLIKIKPLGPEKIISIKIDGKTIHMDQAPYLENDRTFVPIRFIAEALNLKVAWDEETQTAILKDDKVDIRLPLGSQIAMINDKKVVLDAPINIYKGRTFVPVRFVSEAFNCTVKWDGDNYIVDIRTKNNTGVFAVEESYSQEDLYWLARIVNAEANGEPFEGKLAVANVVINRKNSDEYPDTIKEVIFDKKYGYQFTSVLDGTIYNTPSAESIKAAKLALEGRNNIGDALYFLNPRKSENFWIVYSKSFYKSIGLHDFYF
jgi:LysM repeat protein